MYGLVSWLLIFCMSVPFLQPFSIPLAAAKNRMNTQEVVETAPTVVVPEQKELTPEDKILSSMVALDLDGYCTINYPAAYFDYNAAESSGVYKQLEYNDSKSRIYMSYITGMAVGADIPGYIANDLAKVDTYTNDKVVQTYNNVEWMKITADKQIDDCNVYIYYTLNKDNTSAFWMKVKVKPESDDEIFNLIIEKMMNSYYLYALNGESIFGLPTTGYYAENPIESSTQADTSGKVANNDNGNSVFKYRGGYVLGADISDNWDDLEIILDGNKYKFPCKINDFLSTGFTVNDANIAAMLNIAILNQTEEDVEVASNDLAKIELTPKQSVNMKIQNENGTVATLLVYNDNEADKVKITECPVVGITIDKSKYIDNVATAEDEYYNEYTEADENASQNAKDEYNHELILARGATWDAYVDELERIYTHGSFTETIYSTDMKQIIFQLDNKSMTLRMGNLRDIKYIEIKCIK